MKKTWIIVVLLLCFCRYGFSSEIDPTCSDALDFDMDLVDELDRYIDTYETIGQDITIFYNKATDICKNKPVHNDSFCKILKKRYNKLRSNYIKAGNLIIEGIRNDNKKSRNIKKYRILKAKILNELSELYKLIGVDYEKEKINRTRKENY